MKSSALGQQEGSISFAVRSQIRLERETCLFALASALDFLMTWSLLRCQCPTADVEFVESNPVASFFLNNWGLIGLIVFKLVMVCVVAAVCQAIASRRIGAARRVLQFAAVAASLVVVYSAGLMIEHWS
jgi:hypothetical protein